MTAFNPVLNQEIALFDFIKDLETKDREIIERKSENLSIIGNYLKSSITSQAVQEAKNVFITATAMIGISAIRLMSTPRIARFAIDTLGLCVNHLVSNEAKSLITSIINPLATFNEKLGKLFGNNITADILIPAALEELEYRWLIQDVILAKIPKQILNVVAPQYSYLVDSHVAKVSRIALTALLFSISHFHLLNCDELGGIAPLIGGLLYGYVYEYTPLSLSGCINLHGIYNVLVESNLI